MLGSSTFVWSRHGASTGHTWRPDISCCRWMTSSRRRRRWATVRRRRGRVPGRGGGLRRGSWRKSPSWSSQDKWWWSPSRSMAEVRALRSLSPSRTTWPPHGSPLLSLRPSGMTGLVTWSPSLYPQCLASARCAKTGADIAVSAAKFACTLSVLSAFTCVKGERMLLQWGEFGVVKSRRGCCYIVEELMLWNFSAFLSLSSGACTSTYLLKLPVFFNKTSQ